MPFEDQNSHVIHSNRLRHLRSQDRKLNQANYPYLEYPEIYILNGGYKAFYESYKVCISVYAYVDMF